MAFKLVTLVLCLSIANGCKYFKNPGLLLNNFQDSGTNIVVETNRESNTVTAYNALDPVPLVNFTKPIDIMQSDEKNYFVRICESGYLELATTEANLQTCKAQAAITGGQASLTQAIIIADYIDPTAAMTNFQVEAYHMIREQQFDNSNNVTGPSYCDIQILEGIVADCEESHRNNFVIDEALVVTWRSTNSTSGTNYDFQAFIAVTDDNRTFVGFIYENYVKWTGVNGLAKGIIHAKNDGLSGQQRVSQICNSLTDTAIHMKSNCKCAERGHYVFETTESTTSPHGFCGSETGKDTCATSAALEAANQNDPDSSNKNCRTPRYPQETCDDSYYCTLTTTLSTVYDITIFFKNYANKDRAVFMNYTAFTTADGSTGFDNPFGDNIQPNSICINPITSSSNDSFSNITVSGAPNPSSCLTFDSNTNTLNFVLLLYNSVDGNEIYTDGSRIIVGSCDLDDLPQFVNGTIKAGDISSTTVATRTSQKAYLQFHDSRDLMTSQILSSSDTVQLGRYLYPTICYTPAAQYTPDVDAYGLYVIGCDFANNMHFVNDSSTNRSMTVVMDNGCLSSTPAVGSAGRLLEPFRVYNQTTITNPLCQSTRFNAFRWNVNNPPSTLWMRCKVKLCVNTQLFTHSKCFDSCANTLVNANTTDDDDAGRRRRQVADNDEIELMTSITIVDVEMPSEVTKDCADPVMAKSVIGALVSLLIVSILMTIVLFIIFQKQKQC